MYRVPVQVTSYQKAAAVCGPLPVFRHYLDSLLITKLKGNYNSITFQHLDNLNTIYQTHHASSSPSEIWLRPLSRVWWEPVSFLASQHCLCFWEHLQGHSLAPFWRVFMSEKRTEKNVSGTLLLAIKQKPSAETT